MRSTSSPRIGQGISPDTPQGASGLSFVHAGNVAERMAPGLRKTVESHRTLTEEAWVAFLTCHEWQWFGTFTYKDPIHPEAADKQFRFWTRYLDQAYGVARTALPSSPHRLMWVRGLEWQKRGVLHYHALIRNVPYHADTHAERLAVGQKWLEISGGFALIERLHDASASIAYVAKYATKGGEVDLSKNFELPNGTATKQPLLAVQTST